MQLVIKDGIVIATHTDDQQIHNLYPGCEVVRFDVVVSPMSPDPRTVAQRSITYIDNRRNAYPGWREQLDMMYWDIVNKKSTTWVDTIAAIKKQYPTQV